MSDEKNTYNSDIGEDYHIKNILTEIQGFYFKQ